MSTDTARHVGSAPTTLTPLPTTLGDLGDVGGDFDATSTPFAVALGFDPVTGFVDALETNKLVSQCMMDKGFDFVAFDPGISPAELSDAVVDSLGRPSLVDGYGMAAFFVGAESEAGTAPVPNPNDEIVNSLDSAGKVAYLKALFGDAYSEGVVSTDGDFGCSRFSEPGRVGSDDRRRALELAAEETMSSAMADAGFVAAAESWSECMIGVGYSFANRSELLDALRQEFSGLYDAVVDASATGEEPSRSPELVSFQQRELSIARADLDCDANTGYSEAFLDSIVRAQTDYLERNPWLVGLD